MSFSQQQIESLTFNLRQALGDNITWRYEPRLNVMLSEFAQNKSAQVLADLRQNLPDEWQANTVKKLPKALKQQLGDLAKLSKHQMILAIPAKENSPALAALWWPWGHGGTYSLRLKLLTQSYECTPEHVGSSGVFAKIKQLFAVS